MHRRRIGRLVRWTFLGFAAVLGWASEAGAQGAPGVRFGVSGGASIPVQNQDHVYQLGWNATAMVLFNFDAPVGIRLDGSYGEMDTKHDLPGFVGNGSARIISGTADVVLGPRHGWIQPYFLGGVGVYDLRFKGQEVDGSDLFFRFDDSLRVERRDWLRVPPLAGRQCLADLRRRPLHERLAQRGPVHRQRDDRGIAVHVRSRQRRHRFLTPRPLAIHRGTKRAPWAGP